MKELGVFGFEGMTDEPPVLAKILLRSNPCRDANDVIRLRNMFDRMVGDASVIRVTYRCTILGQVRTILSIAYIRGIP